MDRDISLFITALCSELKKTQQKDATQVKQIIDYEIWQSLIHVQFLGNTVLGYLYSWSIAHERYPG